MSVHAFVDESARNQHYLLCAVVIDPAHLKTVRQELRGLLLPGQRELHFSHEKPARRRIIADRIARLPVSATIYRASCTPKTQEKARQQCIGRCVRDLLHQRAHRLVLDSRAHRDGLDEVTIYRELGTRPSLSSLTYEHSDSSLTPPLWIADTVAWCYGARGVWKRRVMPIVTTITDV